MSSRSNCIHSHQITMERRCICHNLRKEKTFKFIDLIAPFLYFGLKYMRKRGKKILYWWESYIGEYWVMLYNGRIPVWKTICLKKKRQLLFSKCKFQTSNFGVHVCVLTCINMWYIYAECLRVSSYILGRRGTSNREAVGSFEAWLYKNTTFEIWKAPYLNTSWRYFRYGRGQVDVGWNPGFIESYQGFDYPSPTGSRLSMAHIRFQRTDWQWVPSILAENTRYNFSLLCVLLLGDGIH